MKKTLRTSLIFLAAVLLFSLVSLAETAKLDDSYAKDDEVVFAALNGVEPYVANLADLETLEETCYWISEYAEMHNIKYVSFNGRMSSSATWNQYNTYLLAGSGLTQQDMIDLNVTDEKAIGEFTALKDAGKILTNAAVPYGVSIRENDYFAGGFNRQNHLNNQFLLDDFVGEAEATIEAFDNNNFAMVVENNGTKYVMYQLETYPRQKVIDWFITTNANHLDKRAFVFTSSFLNADGSMIQYRTTTFRNHAMAAIEDPHEAQLIWDEAFSKADNIVLIMSGDANVGSEIVTKTVKNENGYEVVTAVANLVNGYSAQGAYPVLIKFSEEEKTIDLRYAVPYNEDFVDGGYIEESVVTVKLGKLAPLPEPDPMTLLPKIPAQYNGANTAYINGYAGNVFKPNANMTRAEASTIFARLLVGSTTLPTGNTTRFSDVKEGDWYYDAIAYLDTNNFYMNYDTETYTPNVPITRAEFVELAYFASDLYQKDKVEFTDVDENHKYYDAIMAGASAGLINGYEDHTFRPDATITRAEVVTIINRLLSLSVAEDTIAVDTLENVFSDISGHWAKLHILMASNNNVKSESFLNIDKSIFTENASSISFENKLIKVILNKKNGKVNDIIYLPTGESVLQASSAPWFVYATSRTGAVVSPNGLELADDGRLKFTFKGGYEAYFIVETYDNFFTVELASNFSENLAKMTFGNLYFNYTPSYEDGSFRSSNLSMTTKAGLHHSPGGYDNKDTYAFVHNDINVDVMGAKVGIIFSTYETHRDILKEATMKIDPSKGILSLAGGAFALDNPEYHEDYMLIYDLNLNTLDAYIEHAKKYNIEVLDLHHGTNFYTGNFNFISARTEEEKAAGVTFIDGATFKERITDKLNANGIDIAIHSYASGISPHAADILSDPKWQKDLMYVNEYTLRGDLSKYRATVKTYEDASNYKVDAVAMPTAPTYGTSQYLLIDNEIIQVTQGRGTSSGFMQVSRGQLGTQPTEHKDGAKIYHLRCYWATFQPVVGSELFYHIADNTAKAYNEAGATMIYLDAQESTGKFASSPDTAYYYYQEFNRRVVSQCERPPIIESAAYGNATWNCGGRGGAADAVHRAIKYHKKGHYDTYGLNFPKTFQSMTFGWFNFDTDTGEKYHNTYNKTLFHDDLDFMGSLAIAADYGIVPLGLGVTNNYDGTRLDNNYEYYNVYNKLRKGGYFSEEVKEAIKAGSTETEYRLFEKEDGSFAFKEMYYEGHKINNMSAFDDTSAEYSNPYLSQTPFVRIEQRFSTLGQDGTLVIAFDETADITTLAKEHKFNQMDLSKTKAFKVKVKGNGKKGAILISFTAPNDVKRDDYFIETDFEGWREFILIDPDNREYTGYGFYGVNAFWSDWASNGGSPDYTKINAVTVRTSGDVSGVNIDDITGYELVNSPAKNPSVQVGSSKITFNTEINSGEFIEYYPDTNKAYLNYYDIEYDAEGKVTKNVAHVKEITFDGKLTVPAGSFTAKYNAEALTDAPLRAQVKLGMQGKVIENPETWVAPEIDLGTSSLDIKLY